MQKVRNCLEHRNGVVSAIDVKDGSGVLTLSLPRLRLWIERDGQELELFQNMHVNAGEAIMLQRAIRERRYNPGDRITFTAEEFYEIAQATFLFSQDIASKLPKVQSTAPA